MYREKISSGTCNAGFWNAVFIGFCLAYNGCGIYWPSVIEFAVP